MKQLGDWIKEKLVGVSPAPVLRPVPTPAKQQPPAPHPMKPKGPPAREGDYLRVLFLGGLNHVGINCAVFETNNDIVIVDCGLQFPEAEMLGIDYVIPDVSYLEKNKHKIRGLVVTHGHLDHIGAIKHVLHKIGNPMVFGSRMTIGLIQKQLEESTLPKGARLKAVEHTDHLQLGSFGVDFARVTHNIPGSFAVILKTKWGNIVHTGDFKFDFTAPAPNDVPDFEKLWNVGKEGVLLLLSDSTNALEEGYAKPEIEVGEFLGQTIAECKGRLIIASFASNLARIQQIINYAVIHNRQIFLSGRSMVNNVAIAKKLGYINFPEKFVHKMSKAINDYPDEQILILSTGSQGEEFAALSRMANDSHAQVKIQKKDTIVFSSHPIPGTGNERSIYTNINKFLTKGAKVLANEDLDVHTTGHGKREDLKLMLQLTEPRYFIPVHGELFMRSAHKEVALKVGMKESEIFLLQNGSSVDFKQNQPPLINMTKLELKDVYIDGLGGTESAGDKVLDERKIMSQDGTVIIVYKISSKDRKLIGAPKVISKGFIYLEELEKIQRSVVEEAKKLYEEMTSRARGAKQKDMRYDIQYRLGAFIEKKIGRTPMIIPILIEL